MRRPDGRRSGPAAGTFVVRDPRLGGSLGRTSLQHPFGNDEHMAEGPEPRERDRRIEAEDVTALRDSRAASLLAERMISNAEEMLPEWLWTDGGGVITTMISSGGTDLART